MTMRIRNFDRRDQDVARRIIQDGLRERWGQAFDPGANPDTDDLWDSYMTGGSELVVAELDGGPIVATAATVRDDERVGRIVRLSVDEAFRRRGIARALVAEIVERARRRGDRRVVVSTDTPWSDAIALYRTCGFSVVGIDDTDTHLALELG